jgi:hypothetical protein
MACGESSQRDIQTQFCFNLILFFFQRNPGGLRAAACADNERYSNFFCLFPFFFHFFLATQVACAPRRARILNDIQTQLSQVVADVVDLYTVDFYNGTIDI